MNNQPTYETKRIFPFALTESMIGYDAKRIISINLTSKEKTAVEDLTDKLLEEQIKRFGHVFLPEIYSKNTLYLSHGHLKTIFL